jgi:FHA domain
MNKLTKERFFKACGGTAPIRFVLENEQNRSKSIFSFEQPNILVGRHPAAELRIEHPEIGQRHLYLQMLDGRLFGIALPEAKTASWPGMTKKSGWIAAQDSICFGPFTLHAIDGLNSQPQTTATANPLASVPNGVPPLWFEHRYSRDKTFRGVLNRSLSFVGNSEFCKFRIRSERVSSIHCVLVRGAEGVWAVDLGGRGGIVLNDNAAAVALLKEGDIFQIGGIPFNIHYEGALPGPAPTMTSALVPAVSAVKTADWRLEESAPIAAGYPENFERLINPVLEHFSAFQNQTFQQFQDMLANVMQTFGGMFQQQQDFIREEMRRFDRLTAELAQLQQTLRTLSPSTAEAALPDKEELPEMPKAAPTPRLPDAPPVDPQMHAWLHSRISELNNQRSNFWKQLSDLLRGRNPK